MSLTTRRRPHRRRGRLPLPWLEPNADTGRADGRGALQTRAAAARRARRRGPRPGATPARVRRRLRAVGAADRGRRRRPRRPLVRLPVAAARARVLGVRGEPGADRRPLLDGARVRGRTDGRAWGGVHRLAPQADPRAREAIRVRAHRSLPSFESRQSAAVAQRRPASSPRAALQPQRVPAPDRGGGTPGRPVRLLRRNPGGPRLRRAHRRRLARRQLPGRQPWETGAAGVGRDGKRVRPRRGPAQRPQPLLRVRREHPRRRRALPRPRGQRPDRARARWAAARRDGPARGGAGGALRAGRWQLRDALRRRGRRGGRRPGRARDPVCDPAPGRPRRRGAERQEATLHPTSSGWVRTPRC